MKDKLHLYSIMPLNIEHIDEICEDIKNQYESGATNYALFKMALVPEGNPPVDKAKIMCEKYEKFREKLSGMGLKSGVLVQASIGHGWVLSEKFPYQHYVGVKEDGDSEYIACPYDEGFREYIYNAMRTIASYKPDCIMVDDDFRLMFRSGNGCACPLHMKRFHELSGTNLTKEELWRELSDGNEEIQKIFVETQRESLVDTAKAMRAGIDSVDATIPGAFCCVGSNTEFGAEIANVLKGEGNPSVLRINNGNYTAAGSRYYSNVFLRGAAQIAKVKGKVDMILGEPDTCPQNRYSTPAMGVHAHMTGTILEGAKGAKHWITRLAAYEPESGKAYRKILAKNRGFYEELADYSDKLKWRGARIPVFGEPRFYFGEKSGYYIGSDGNNGWSECVLERFGIPTYFSPEQGGVACLERPIDSRMSDDEIMKILSGAVFLASDTAKSLIERGFGDYLGVDVREWKGKQPSGEYLPIENNRLPVQCGIFELVPNKAETKVDSVVYHTVDDIEYEDLFPAVTVYKNSLGGTVCIFSGTPKTEYHITTAFSFLNYSRKHQLLRLINMMGELPVYYSGDEEMYLRAADMDDGGLFCALFNLGVDPIDKIELVCEKKVSRVEKLMSDGTRTEVSFESADGKYIIDTPSYTLNPVILFIY